jgi:hypothetical protein
MDKESKGVKGFRKTLLMEPKPFSTCPLQRLRETLAYVGKGSPWWMPQKR